MPFVHYAFVGHFIPEDGFIRIERGRPACEKPLDMSAISELFRTHIGTECNIDDIPRNWGMAITSDFIIGTFYRSNREALSFMADYAKQTDAYIADMGRWALLNPEELKSV